MKISACPEQQPGYGDEHPEIPAYRDEEIYFQRRTSVLGADNKQR